jgi:hypothetical protein
MNRKVILVVIGFATAIGVATMLTGCEANYSTWQNQWDGHRWVTPMAPPPCPIQPRTVDVYYPDGTVRRFYNQ